MLKEHDVKAIKASKSIVVLLSPYHNGNITLMFYIKYNINVFQKNTAYDIKSQKENMGIVKSYILNIFLIVIQFFLFF